MIGSYKFATRVNRADLRSLCRGFRIAPLSFFLALATTSVTFGQDKPNSLQVLTEHLPSIEMPLDPAGTPPQISIKPTVLSPVPMNPAGYQIQIEPLREAEGQFRMKLMLPVSIRELEITPYGSLVQPQSLQACTPIQLNSHVVGIQAVHECLNGSMGGAASVSAEDKKEKSTLAQADLNIRSVHRDQAPTARVFFKNPFFERPHPISLNEVSDSNGGRSGSERAVYLTTGYESVEKFLADDWAVDAEQNSDRKAEANTSPPVFMSFTDEEMGDSERLRSFPSYKIER